MFAQLGNIKFEGVKGLDSMSRRRDSILAEHAVILGKPRLQKIGNGLDRYSIVAHFHTAFCVPEDELSALNNYRLSGEILPFILGTGEILGSFVIASLQDDPVAFDGLGGVVDLYVAIELTENYDPDAEATKEAQARDNAPAIRLPTTQPIRDTGGLPPTPAALVSEDFSEASVMAGAIDGDLGKAERIPEREDYYYGRIKKALDKIEDVMSEGTAKLNELSDLTTQFPNLLTSAAAVANAAATFKSAFPPGFISDLKAVNSSLQLSVDNLNRNSAGMNNLITSRKI